MAFYHMQMQQENIDTGQYQVTVSDRLNNRPIENARVRISYTGAPDSTIEEVTTDSSGRTPVIELKTPPLEYSMEPVEQQPYSEYTIQIEAEGFEPKEIAGSQVLADTLSRQPTTLNVMESGETFQRIVIPPHTLFYEYPPKIEEAEIKPINENGEIVLSKVVVPEYIVVHDGPVNDSAAGNYYVRYKDYIKNVASSEIYATWPDDTIRANVLAITGHETGAPFHAGIKAVPAPIRTSASSCMPSSRYSTLSTLPYSRTREIREPAVYGSRVRLHHDAPGRGEIAAAPGHPDLRHERPEPRL